MRAILAAAVLASCSSPPVERVEETSLCDITRRDIGTTVRVLGIYSTDMIESSLFEDINCQDISARFTFRENESVAENLRRYLRVRMEAEGIPIYAHISVTGQISEIDGSIIIIEVEDFRVIDDAAEYREMGTYTD